MGLLLFIHNLPSVLQYLKNIKSNMKLLFQSCIVICKLQLKSFESFQNAVCAEQGVVFPKVHQTFKTL